jgi:hypothetical protein
MGDSFLLQVYFIIKVIFDEFQGGYPPEIKCFDLIQMHMKFERHVTADIVQFQMFDIFDFICLFF